MDSDKTPSSPEHDESLAQAPADALSRTPDELSESAAAEQSTSPAAVPTEKKVSALKQFLKHLNVYFLFFVLIVVVAGAIAVVTYLNSQKPSEEAATASQELGEETLKQLANTDVSVGDTSQTLTIQGNAIIAGQTLLRGNLNVAGNIQAGGSLQAPTLTISGATNLGDTQSNTLQVAQNAAVQGTTTLRDLNVSGASSFSGAMTASQITVNRLIISGNGSLEIPNHLSFSGPAPGRGTINGGVLGNGGSASVDGSDTAGSININTGNNPTPGCFIQVTFAQAFSREPRVIVSPIGAGAGLSQYYVTRSKTGFSLCTANASPANQAFSFDYFISG